MKALLEKIKFDEKGLIPFITQDANTKEVLTLAYMNDEALKLTLETGKIHVFRRSRGRVMMKGETSGMVQEVKEIRLDCEGNSLLILAEPKGPACHKMFWTCYFEEYKPDSDSFVTHGEPLLDPKEVYKGKE